ncbi:MAG: radical SAM protein [candidate division WOR-3 bacterium]
MKILLINPPIYDFAAYDFWMKPLGLLYISSLLKKEKHKVYLLDVVDRLDNYFREIKNDSLGRGKLKFVKVEKPKILEKIPGKFKRYGLPKRVIFERVKEFKPEVVMVSCSMTYWYLGLIEIREIINSLENKPILILGGIYPSLLPEHAKELGFERVYPIGEKYIKEIDFKIPDHFGLFPLPDYSHYSRLNYVALSTSVGCPFSCPYCATPYLYEKKEEKEEEQVVDEIYYFYKKGITKFAFYDDALLIPPERFINLCEEIKERGIKAYFFTPNGLHPRFISKEIARLMYEAGFKEPRLSLETSDEIIQEKFYLKTSNYEYVKAIENLLKVGYKKGEIYTYLLVGVPGISYESVEKSILFVGKVGVKVSLAEFSPIPKTPMDENLPDPLLTNNTVYYRYKNEEDKMIKVKKLAKEVNKKATNF